MEWSAKAVAGVLVSGKHCSSIASLVCSSPEQIKLLLDCSDQVSCMCCSSSFMSIQVWLKLLNLASTHGSISPQNCNMLRDVCHHSLANLAYFWVPSSSYFWPFYRHFHRWWWENLGKTDFSARVCRLHPQTSWYSILSLILNKLVKLWHHWNNYTLLELITHDIMNVHHEYSS